MRQKVNISMNEQLLALLDEYADEVYSTRSGIICQALVNFFSQRQAIKALQELVTLLKRIERTIAEHGGLTDEDKQQLKDLEALISMLPTIQ